jgi:hypothetical protein
MSRLEWVRWCPGCDSPIEVWVEPDGGVPSQAKAIVSVRRHCPPRCPLMEQTVVITQRDAEEAKQ